MKMIQIPSLTTAASLIIFVAILTVYASIGYAAENDMPDVTMSVLESEEDAERIVAEILLPPTAAPSAQEHAARGLDTANQARERGREFGLERAEQARDRGKPPGGGPPGGGPPGGGPPGGGPPGGL